MPAATAALVIFAATAAVSDASGLQNELTAALQPIMTAKSKEWNSTGIGLSVWAPRRNVSVDLAAGQARSQSDAIPVTTQTRWLFGSATKMFTATAVLRLVEQGHLHLEGLMQPTVDAALHRLNGSSLLSLGFDSIILNATIQNLLSMHSGIYDLPESLRRWQNAAPSHDFGPIELLWLTNKQAACAPGSCGEYSDVNYILLGLILMEHQNSSSWEQTLQNSSFPGTVAPPSIEFALDGPLSNYANAADGYQPDAVDVWNLSALSGWTCGNVISNTQDMAKFVYELYGYARCQVVHCQTVYQMLQFEQLSVYFPVWYGLGTMGIYTDFYGHGGATWGFYSLSGYNPYLDFAFVLSLNHETVIFQQNLMDIHGALYAEIKKILNQTAVV